MKAIDCSVPIIMLTAYDYHDKMEGIPSDGFVIKSSDTTELLRMIRKFSNGTIERTRPS
jgi:hypothetical protein